MDGGRRLSVFAWGGGGGCVTVLACLIFVLFVLAQATWVVIKETPDVIWVVFHKRTAI